MKPVRHNAAKLLPMTLLSPIIQFHILGSVTSGYSGGGSHPGGLIPATLLLILVASFKAASIACHSV